MEAVAHTGDHHGGIAMTDTATTYDWITVTQLVLKYAGAGVFVSDRTVRNWIVDGPLTQHSKRVGGRWFINATELEKAEIGENPNS